MDAGGRATHGAVAERDGVKRVKSPIYSPLIPAFSLWRRSNRTCVETYRYVGAVAPQGFYFW
jgi:hypothetical protein